MRFHDPLFFLLLPVLLALFWQARRRRRVPGFSFPSGEILKKLKKPLRVRLAQNLIWVRLAAAVFFICALARPQSPVADSKIRTEGVDIVLALDCSTSMRAEDFTWNGKRRNRLEVVKGVVEEFIGARSNDRIGLVAFAARAYTVCPLTLDYAWLRENSARVQIGMIEDGTAVGMGLAAALNRLKGTKAKSKVVVLLTDGRNNTGAISPQAAAEAARALRVKVYTIGAGTKGRAPYPVQGLFGNTVYQMVDVDLDEDTLRQIAALTGGAYFRATDTQELRSIYRQIDALEKSPVQAQGFAQYRELFGFFLVAGLVVLAAEIAAAGTFLRTIP